MSDEIQPMNFRVVYSERQVADPGHDPVHGVLSPSAGKPRLMADALQSRYPGLTFVDPQPLSLADFGRCHDPAYIADVLTKRRPNGFGTRSDSVNASLPYTSGALYTAARIATPDRPACALVAGFHHAGYAGFDGFGYFCTFNGLVATAMKLIHCGYASKVAILDCDMHWGNGTDDILGRVQWTRGRIINLSFGRRYTSPVDASDYLDALGSGGWAVRSIREFRPDVILYQAGADVHVNDPFGGVLTEDQMKERDRIVFRLVRRMGVPLAWCLAGGYQVDPDGGIGTVLRLHLNTFEACDEVYGEFA